MGEVVNFPSIDERAWRSLDKTLRDELKDGLPPAAVDWILDDMHPRFLAAASSLSVTLPVAVAIPPECRDLLDTVVSVVSEYVQAASTRWMLQMAVLEAELYGERFGGSPPPGQNRPADHGSEPVHAFGRAAASPPHAGICS